MFTVDQVFEELKDIQWGFINEYWFEFEKESCGRWYITIHDECGDALYDGYWPNSEDKTLKQAIEEGLKGAELLKQEQE